MDNYFINGKELKEGMKIQPKGINKPLIIHKDKFGLFIKSKFLLRIHLNPNMYLNNLNLTSFEIVE